MKYADKFKDPRWQKKRLEILERDDWCCQSCYDSENTLHVHHRWYEKGKDPWDYPDECLVTLCEECHNGETIQMAKACQDLIEAMKKHFFADSVSDIAAGFDNLALLHMPDIQATAIGYCLQTPQIMQTLMDLHAEGLRESIKQYQEHRDTLICRKDASS